MRARVYVVGLWVFALGCGEPIENVAPDTETVETSPSPPLSPPVAMPEGPLGRQEEEPSPAGPKAATSLELSIELVEKDFTVEAVDSEGTAYGLRFDSGSELWASTDNARTWTPRGEAPEGYGFRKLMALSGGLLIADLQQSGRHRLARSLDHGVTWEPVLDIGEFRMLQPHSVAELGGTLFYGEYQSATGTTRIRLWASEDRGATWSVRSTFEQYRHIHSVIPDPDKGALWLLVGDSNGEILRSKDGGHTWAAVVTGPDAVSVDAAPMADGLLYGVDAVNKPREPLLIRINHDDTTEVLFRLPGPSYSILPLATGGVLSGSSRATGDVHEPDDVSARLFGSVDGREWKELLSYERLKEGSTAHVNVYWSLPSGEVVVELRNIKEFAPDGEGYLVAKPVYR